MTYINRDYSQNALKYTNKKKQITFTHQIRITRHYKINIEWLFIKTNTNLKRTTIGIVVFDLTMFIKIKYFKNNIQKHKHLRHGIGVNEIMKFLIKLINPNTNQTLLWNNN